MSVNLCDRASSASSHIHVCSSNTIRMFTKFVMSITVQHKCLCEKSTQIIVNASQTMRHVYGVFFCSLRHKCAIIADDIFLVFGFHSIEIALIYVALPNKSCARHTSSSSSSNNCSPRRDSIAERLVSTSW